MIKPQYTDVTRAQSKASIVIQGLSGKGKSGLALALGYVLADEDWSKVFATDTENRSLNLFEGIAMHTGDKFGTFKKFDLLKIHGYKPSNYLACKQAAIDNGAKVFIQDSITHAWVGHGGVLQMVTKSEQANLNLNKFNAWGQPEIMHERDSMYEMIRDSEVHMIATVRVKEKFTMKTGEGVHSIGEQQIQMPDLKYEPDLVLDMLSSGTTEGRPPKAKVIKSRYAILAEGETYEFTKDLMEQLKDYLAEGADPAEMMEKQRLEFIAEITHILDSSKSKQTVWTIHKADLGVEDMPLDEMPLGIVRKLLTRILE